ncbi:hypothetical protein BGX23_001139 [Mortierella sp. AD031]|nr:hypothetical protein BGX23_001139 [Mortierella sp. AD031]KAG0209419.1 hypothetical protein BGX33_005530 [Mortierella sp. NVP41]
MAGWFNANAHVHAHHDRAAGRANNYDGATALPPNLSIQDLVTTFLLDRYSLQNPVTTGFDSNNTNTPTTRPNALRDVTNYQIDAVAPTPDIYSPKQTNVAQTRMSTFGGVSDFSSPLSAGGAFNYNNCNNNNASTASGTLQQSWPVFSSPIVVTTASAAGRTLAETKEQSNWTHLSAPSLHLALILKIPVRPNRQGHPETSQPLLLVQSGNKVLDCLDLDPATIRSSKLRFIVKGGMMGFHYTLSSPASPSGPSMSEKSRKRQIKFKNVADCGQCATLLSNWIESQAINPKSVVTVYAPSTKESLFAGGSSQDVDMTMTPSSSQSTNFTKTTGTGTAVAASPSTTSTFSPLSPILNMYSSSAVAYASHRPATPVSVRRSQEFVVPGSGSQMSMSSPPPQQQHQQLKQHRRRHNKVGGKDKNREKLVSITPRLGSQPLPVSPVPGFSFPIPIGTGAGTGGGGGGGGQLQENNDSNGNNTGLGRLLTMSDVDLQLEILSILQDVEFPDMLLKVEQACHGLAYGSQ